MCYRAPGPRCSSHALKAHERAVEHWVNEGDDSAYKHMRQTQKDLDMTPQGQKLLREEIAKTQDEGKRQQLAQRLEYGVAARQWALKALREADRGDVEDSHTPELAVPEPEDPVTREDLRVALKESGIRGSVRVTQHHDGAFIVNIEDEDGDYRIDFNKNGSVLAFKDYDDDEELLTHAQPALFARLDPCSDPSVYAHRAKEYLANLRDESKDWDADEHAAKFTYFGEASGDINASLRKGTLSPTLTRTLDKVMTSHVLTEDTVVYSGIRTQGRDSLHEQIKAGTFVQPGYLSTTTKESVARGFGGGGNYRGALLKITLPAGTRCHDARRGSEEEITLPRNFDLSNAQWEFTG